MRSYDLNIADFNIRFESATEGPELLLSERFHNFVVPGGDYDLLIRVHSGDFMISPEAKVTFNAPYVEEVNGLRLKKNDEFWSILRFREDLFIRTVFPYTGEKREAVLKFSLRGREWDLWPGQDLKAADPMEYPLDGLILYYLTVIFNDIMIHASGACHNERGYLFSGVSGKGKTTIAKLWNQHGARIIHDDRLIIRKHGGRYSMYNTPVYNNDKPAAAEIDRIFLIEHGTRNEIIPVSGAAGVSQVMSNCIQHNWDPGIISRLLDSVSLMAESVPVARLDFLPDHSVIDYILEYDRER